MVLRRIVRLHADKGSSASSDYRAVCPLSSVNTERPSGTPFDR